MENPDYESWLDPAVYEYIRNNRGNVDSVDIVSHFKLRADITLAAVSRLEIAGRIEEREAVWNIQPYRWFITEVV
jgi:hypothetical protein